MKTLSAGLMAVIFWGFVATAPVRAQLVSQGPFSPSAATVEFWGCLACPGGEWWNPALSQAADSQFAVVPLTAYGFCFMTSCFYSRALIATEFGFSVPPNATITGIMVEVLRKGFTTNAIHDTLVYLMKNNQVAGLPKVSSDPWPLIAQYEAYGDTADLWGTVWTPADINSKQFGVYVKPVNRSNAMDSAAVDHIQVTVHYTMPTGIGGIQSSGATAYVDATGRMLVLLGLSACRSLEVTVVDAEGRIAGLFRPAVHDGSAVRLPLGRLPSGIYAARCMDERGVRILRFVIP